MSKKGGFYMSAIAVYPAVRCVAPPAGAWIETYVQLKEIADLGVAPPAGAWIETCTER